MGRSLANQNGLHEKKKQRIIALCRGFLLVKDKEPDKALTFCKGILLELIQNNKN